MIAFRVPGLPKSQGSKKHVGRGILVEQVKGLHDWRKTVEMCARRAVGYSRPMLDGPVLVIVEFTFPRPKNRPDDIRHAVAPDSDKCARAILDSLQAAQVVSNDSRVSDLVVTKRYGPEPGAYIAVSTGQLDLTQIVQHARATEPLALTDAA